MNRFVINLRIGKKLKGWFGILHLKPCFKIVSDEIEQLRLKF